MVKFGKEERGEARKKKLSVTYDVFVAATAVVGLAGPISIRGSSQPFILLARSGMVDCGAGSAAECPGS